MDDYSALNDVFSNTFEIANLTAAILMVIIYGLVITIFFHLFNSVDKLWFIRFIGILGLCIVFILLLRLLINNKFQYIEAFFISLGACLLPPFVENIQLGYYCCPFMERCDCVAWSA